VCVFVWSGGGAYLALLVDDGHGVLQLDVVEEARQEHVGHPDQTVVLLLVEERVGAFEIGSHHLRKRKRKNGGGHEHVTTTSKGPTSQNDFSLTGTHAYECFISIFFVPFSHPVSLLSNRGCKMAYAKSKPANSDRCKVTCRHIES